MNHYLLFILFIILSSSTFAQKEIEEDIEVAFQNAKKGIYWALNNIPEEKSRIEGELVDDDKLYCNVKLYKEVNGIKIESTGFNHSNEVTVKIYRSNNSLVKYGYLKKEDE